MDGIRRTVLASLTSLLLLPSGTSLAQPSGNTDAGTAAAAAKLADIFSKIGDQIYEDCIFDLSPEQIVVQDALIKAYVAHGASSAAARQLAVKQIQAPKLSQKCEQLRRQPQAAPTTWETKTTLLVPKKPKKKAAPKRRPKPAPKIPAPAIVLKDKKILPQWDCAPNVDYVTVRIKGYERKLTGGEICKPYKDVVHKVPASVRPFRLGYAISTGRLFIVADDPKVSGRTIAWAISGKDVCRNNPDPDCLAARGVGSLPPGKYSFAADKKRRITWGPITKRNVSGIYLRKLWNKDRFTKAQLKAIRKRGNIAIHVRLKGEMSEACIGLEPKGWAYIASLIKEGRARGVNAYSEEPYPQIAEAPPVVAGSSFSLTSLFK